MTWPIVTVAIERESDLVAVRQRARKIAELLGFDAQDQTRVGTAVSEIARNALGYGGGGRAEFAFDHKGRPQALSIRIVDRGPGIAELGDVLAGRYRSRTGMGLGIVGARRLMDGFEIASTPGSGTSVTLTKALPKRAEPIGRAQLQEVVRRLALEGPVDPLAEMRAQNQELLRSLESIQARQEELATLNTELEDTNRGVVALYAELDEKAQQLRSASEMKSRFLSNMSHEFRTPVNSILALSRILLDGIDGPLNDEQRRQVGYIRSSAESLSDLVNDLLDLAKVEAGKTELRPTEFKLVDLFASLKGVLRPLKSREGVDLVFEEPPEMPALFTDEAKLAQIVRNLVSNALKFTEAGEVRIVASYDEGTDRLRIAVRDTGIGIAPQHHRAVFEEFTQVESPLHARSKGTGLGLPLSRKLTELLGGEIALDSALGAGSTFTVDLPRRLDARPEADLAASAPTGRLRVLVVDDDEAFRYALRQMIGSARHEVIEACDGEEGLVQARAHRPDAVVLDLNMPRLDGYAMLVELRLDPTTAAIPVIVVTSAVPNDEQRRALGDIEQVFSKGALTREALSAALEHAWRRGNSR